MNPVVDYHMHTPLCGHAVGQPEEYVKQAITNGLKEIGFSDHAPLLSHDDPGVTMSKEQLGEYHQMIEDVRDRYEDQITIKVGIEADYLLKFEEQTKEMLSSYPYDYIIGSVHFINQWGFDNPAEQDQWDNADIDSIYRQYYELLRRSAQLKIFNIMGHVDLVKKFGHRPTADFKEEVAVTAQVFKDCRVAVEINTAGLRKPVKEIYPSLDVLKIYYQTGVPLTFGSDAHDPKDVGRDYDQALELAKAAGYKEYVLFKQQKIERTVQL